MRGRKQGRRRRPRCVRARRPPAIPPTTLTNCAATTTARPRRRGHTAWLSQMRRWACWRSPLVRRKRRPLSRAPLESESASAVPPPQPGAMSDDGPAIGPAAEPEAAAFDSPILGNQPVVPAPQPDDGQPVAAVGREQILAAFNRSRVPPQPTPAPPATSQLRTAHAPNATIRRQAAPAEHEMTDEGWEELIAGFVAGNVVWNTRRLGPEPGNHGCRAPQSVLRRYRL
jgi:hypothetical protein